MAGGSLRELEGNEEGLLLWRISGLSRESNLLGISVSLNSFLLQSKYGAEVI